MPVGHFTGQVFPLSSRLTSNWVHRVQLSKSDFGQRVTFTIAIVESVLDIECELETYTDDMLGFLHSRAFDLARACIDVVAFGTGQGLTIEVDTFTRPDGTAIPVTFANRYLANECTIFTANPSTPEHTEDFHAVINVVLREPYLFLVLNDLIQTLYVPHQVATACGRVLDGLRRMGAPDVEDKKIGWPILHGIVNAERAYMEWITTQSTNPRHGDKSPRGSAINKEILRRTWAIMNRFLEYRKRGNQPLPITEFPLLSGDPPS